MEKSDLALIENSVRRIIEETLLSASDQYVCGEELQAHIGFMTPSWVRRYGELLPRCCIQVKGKDGKLHKSAWVYPIGKIKRMLADGRLKVLNAVILV